MHACAKKGAEEVQIVCFARKESLPLGFRSEKINHVCTTCPKINLLFLCELLKHLLLMKKREKGTDVISSKQKQKT